MPNSIQTCLGTKRGQQVAIVGVIVGSVALIAGIMFGVVLKPTSNKPSSSPAMGLPTAPPPFATSPTVTASSPPASSPTLPSSALPQAGSQTLTTCQVQAGCQGQTSIPVVASGSDFKKTILEYLNDPASSPHGSNINCWDVSQVSDMSFAFSYLLSHTFYDSDLDNLLFVSFDNPLNCWDTSNVQSMRGMFYGNYLFNQEIGSWDVSSVTDMSYMFDEAYNFDSAIGGWDVSSVTNMSYMFYGTPFNQDIGSWDVSRVTDMTGMFWGAYSFNQDIGSWDVSSVTNMSEILRFTDVFNQDIASWDVSSVSDMRYMLSAAILFNQNLCAWGEKIDLFQVDVESIFAYSGCEVTSQPTPSSSISTWCQTC
jgi:surface protein